MLFRSRVMVTEPRCLGYKLTNMRRTYLYQNLCRPTSLLYRTRSLQGTIPPKNIRILIISGCSWAKSIFYVIVYISQGPSGLFALQYEALGYFPRVLKLSSPSAAGLREVAYRTKGQTSLERTLHTSPMDQKSSMMHKLKLGLVFAPQRARTAAQRTQQRSHSSAQLTRRSKAA